MRLINQDEAPSLNRTLRSLRAFPIDLVKVYPRSFCSRDELTYGMLRTTGGQKLAIMGDRSDVLRDPFQGECYHQSFSLKLCELSRENTECLKNLFPHTKPVSLRNFPMTISVGDSFGYAAPGQIRAVRKFQARPVLSGASLIKNGRAGKNLSEVIPDPAWSVFQENHQEGYGADAGHLSSLQEFERALDAGASVVTLDPSEKIDPEVLRQPKGLVERRFREEIDEGDAKVILHMFLDKEFLFGGKEGGFAIRFDEESAKRNALLFYKALDFIEEVYEWIQPRRKNQDAIDFEISLDRAAFPTSTENHFFLALELSHRGVHIQSFAPRLPGEFQMGIGFEGDRESFRSQFYQHVLIGEDYGYKISIHRGNNECPLLSDIGRLSKGVLDFKAVDASWLEAIRLIALADPVLYREIHSLALFEVGRERWPRRVNLKSVPDLEELRDKDLRALLDQADCRQLFQIAYEALLNAGTPSGESLLMNKVRQTLMLYEEDYWSLLEEYIEKDLTALGVKKKEKEKEEPKERKK